METIQAQKSRRLRKDPTKWSPQQEEILAWFDGTHPEAHRNLVISARAGTGKSTTILRGVYISQAESVRMLAFGVRVAEELSQKLAQKGYGGSGRVKATTLHAYGHHLFFARDAKQVPIWGTNKTRPEPQVDNKRDRRLLEAFSQEKNSLIFRTKEVREPLLELISKAKQVMPFVGAEPAQEKQDIEILVKLQNQFGCAPPLAMQEAGFTKEEAARVVLVILARSILLHDGTLTNDDQIFLPLRRGWIEGKHDLVVIDECQDMSPVQLEMALRVVSKGGRIAVVGDINQAIYAWRGADSEALKRFPKDLNAIELPLTVTRRCAKSVVAQVTHWVPDIEAHADAPEGIVHTGISKATMLDQLQQGDFVISRVNSPLPDIAFSLIKRGLRARILGRDKFKKQVIDLIKRLQDQQGAYDIPSLFIALGNWHKARMDKMNGQGATDRELQRQEDYYSFLVELTMASDNIAALINQIDVLLVGDDDAMDPATFVTCTTVHQAKGLEANRVFILDNTLFLPKGDPQEEMNIAYVAYTRAKFELWRCLIPGWRGGPQ